MGIPIIKGDGVHDDTAGLSAAFNGEPFECDPPADVFWQTVDGIPTLFILGPWCSKTELLKQTVYQDPHGLPHLNNLPLGRAGL